MVEHICAACRTVRATFFCSADAAFLCALCDVTVHEANKLARRHKRVPIRPHTHPDLDNRLPHVEATISTGSEKVQQSEWAPCLETACEESDHSSELLEVPQLRQTDEIYRHPQRGDFGFHRHLLKKQETSMLENDALDLHVVPNKEVERQQYLKTMAGMFVKKEAQTLLESSGCQTLNPTLSHEATASIPNVLLSEPSQRESFTDHVNVHTSMTDPDCTNVTLLSHGGDFSFEHKARQESDAMTESVSSAPPSEQILLLPADGTNGLPALASIATDFADKTAEVKRRERQAALKRFRTKRANRSFRKKVRYVCRKQLADSRPRVKGRFVGRAEPSLTNQNSQSGSVSSRT